MAAAVSRFFAVGVEERLAVLEVRRAGEQAVDEVGDGALGCLPHLAGYFRKLVQIVVDDGLTGNAEQLPVGGDAEHRSPVADRAVGVFAVFVHAVERGKGFERRAGMLAEVRRRGLARPQGIGFLRLFGPGQHGPVRGVGEDGREVGRGERAAYHVHVAARGLPGPAQAVAGQFRQGEAAQLFRTGGGRFDHAPERGTQYQRIGGGRPELFVLILPHADAESGDGLAVPGGYGVEHLRPEGVKVHMLADGAFRQFRHPVPDGEGQNIGGAGRVVGDDGFLHRVGSGDGQRLRSGAVFLDGGRGDGFGRRLGRERIRHGCLRVTLLRAGFGGVVRPDGRQGTFPDGPFADHADGPGERTPGFPDKARFAFGNPVRFVHAVAHGNVGKMPFGDLAERVSGGAGKVRRGQQAFAFHAQAAQGTELIFDGTAAVRVEQRNLFREGAAGHEQDFVNHAAFPVPDGDASFRGQHEIDGARRIVQRGGRLAQAERGVAGRQIIFWHRVLRGW